LSLLFSCFLLCLCCFIIFRDNFTTTIHKLFQFINKFCINETDRWCRNLSISTIKTLQV
jgi:hypothetical protein